MILWFFFHVDTSTAVMSFWYVSCIPWYDIRQSSSFKHFKLYQLIMSDQLQSQNLLNIPLNIQSPIQKNVDFEHPSYLQQKEHKESLEEQDLQQSKIEEDHYSSYRQFQNEMKKSVYYSSPQFSQHSRRKESYDSFKPSPQFKMKKKQIQHEIIPEEDLGKLKYWNSSFLNTVLSVVKFINLQQIVRFKKLEKFQLKLIKDQSSSYKQYSEMGFFAKNQESALNQFLNQKLVDEDDSIIWSIIVVIFYLFSFLYLTLDLIINSNMVILLFQIFFPIFEAIYYMNMKQVNQTKVYDKRIDVIKLYYKQWFFFDIAYILIIILRLALDVKILSLGVFLRFNRFSTAFDIIINYLDVSSNYLYLQCISRALLLLFIINLIFTCLRMNLDSDHLLDINQFLDQFYLALVQLALIESNTQYISKPQILLSIVMIFTSLSLLLYFIYVIHSCTNLNIKLNSKLKQYQQQGLSSNLLWKIKKTGNLNQKLKNQIQWDLYGQVFNRTKILKNICSPKIKKELSYKWIQQFYEEDQIIVKKDDPCQRLYYIQQGVVEIKLNNSTITLKEGEFFDEIGFIQDNHYKFTYIAQEKTTLLVINVEDFNQIIKNDQETLEKLHMIKIPDYGDQQCIVCNQMGHELIKCKKIFYVHDYLHTISKHKYSVDQVRKSLFRGFKLRINEKRNKQRIFQSALFYALQEGFFKEEELTNQFMNSLQGNSYDQNQIDAFFNEDEKSKFSSLMEKQQTEFGIPSHNSPQTSSNQKANTTPIQPLRLESDKESSNVSNSKPGTNFMMNQMEKYSSSISSIKLNYYKSSISSDQILGSSRKVQHQLGKNQSAYSMKKVNTTFSKIDEIDFPNSNNSSIFLAPFTSFLDKMQNYPFYFPDFNFQVIEQKLNKSKEDSKVSFQQNKNGMNYFTVHQIEEYRKKDSISY